MKKYLLPDYDFPTFVGVTPEFLKSIGKNAVLCDIDNTLVPYDQALPTDEVCAWVRNLLDNGIKIAFVSNNEKERVEKFNENIGIPYLYKSGKPSRKTVKRGTQLLGSTYEETVMLGDQLLTDVLTARISGITAIWVPTIKKVETPFFRCKSAIEKPYIKYYFKNKQKGGKNE